MVYQGFKVLRRNPTVSHPRIFMYCFVGYWAFQVLNHHWAPKTMNVFEYENPHSQDFAELQRRYNVKKATEFRQYILDERDKLDIKLKQNAGQSV